MTARLTEAQIDFIVVQEELEEERIISLSGARILARCANSDECGYEDSEPIQDPLDPVQRKQAEDMLLDRFEKHLEECDAIYLVID